MTSVGFDLSGNPETGSGMKRIGDLAIASTLIALTLPLMAVVALAIKLDGAGPVLMREERCIGDNRRVTVFKFRTTPHRPGRVWPWPPQPSGIGRFLHYTRIVDLPQLANVLRGEMSLVGTGALRPDFLA
jgi:lipopolysaccharide/colanic/teichoic acid biosynthesis glycosyltransferase